VIFAQGPESWIWWSWVASHTDDIVDALRQHVVFTVVAVGAGLLLSLPLAVVAHQWRWLLGPVLGTAGILYTIPSLAAFALLVPYTGLTTLTALVPLVTYTLFILVRSTTAGLDAVPPDVLDAADGMGFRRARRLLRVELPLALPAIVAGVRLATVTTVGLVTITSLITYGGLGRLIYDGFSRDFRTPLVVGAVLSVALAVVADLLLALLGRLLTPWTRTRGAL
jgi:osmoprotectant transport system permease protein